MLRNVLQGKEGGVSGRVCVGRVLAAWLVVVCLFFAATANGEQGYADRDVRVVRVVVIGGMAQTTKMWYAVAEEFEKKTGYTVELVKTAEVPVISKVFRTGAADLLTMHSTDTTTNLVADGYGVNMRPWCHNDVVIMGPADDPAGIAGMTDGVEAMKKIASAGELGVARFVDLWGTGKRELGQNLWDEAGIYPVDKAWFAADCSAKTNKQLVYTASLGNAYCLFGRVPVLQGKVDTAGLEIMVDGDPFMRRPYIVMEANPKKFPWANYIGARKLSSFLVSKEAQGFLAEYGVDEFDGVPPFHPLRNSAFYSEGSEMLEGLIDYLISLDLDGSVAHSLEIELGQALGVLNNQDVTDNSLAIVSLDVFIQKVGARSGKRIPVGAADTLISQAEAIIDVLGTE